MVQAKTSDELIKLICEQRAVEDMLEIDEPTRKAICPDCGGKQFVRAVAYELYQNIDEDGCITDEDSYTWDRRVESPIRCIECERNCDDLFGEEIDPNWQLEVL